jgi:hypothetical protein
VFGCAWLRGFYGKVVVVLQSMASERGDVLERAGVSGVVLHVNG